MQQLDFFESPKTEQEELKEELASMNQKIEVLRKALFKRHSVLADSIQFLQTQVESLNQEIFIIDGYLKKHLKIETPKIDKQVQDE